MDIFNFIKSNVSILDVTKQYAQLKKAGLYWKGHCPFHHEKTASFTVTPHREIFYCFGCNMGGDVITFISKVEQCSTIDAVKLIADRYNLVLPESCTSTLSQSTDEKERYYQLCTLVSNWCHEQLKNNPQATHYLTDRSISSESIDAFAIGFFPTGLQAIQSLVRYAQKQHVLADDLVTANILGQAKQVLYSPFEGRIIFPIKDHLGRCCGFGGRVFKPEDTRAKYYNSRENNYFLKSHLLFGFDLAKQEIQKKSAVFLVEGYTDCIAMHQYSYKNCVATLGTACTQEHLQVLSRYTEQLYILYDGDSAGTQAILRLATLCWQASVDLKVILLPQQEDPASYLNTHKTIEPLLKNAQDIFAFFIDTMTAQFQEKSLKQKLSIARKIIALIAPLDDPLKRDLLLQQAAKLLDLPFESINNEFKRSFYEKKDTPTEVTPENTKISFDSIDQLPLLEKRIFFAIMHNMQLITEENEDYIRAYLPTPLNSIIGELLSLKEAQSSVSFDTFFNHIDDQKKHIVSQLLVSFDQAVEQDEFNQLLIQLQKKYWKKIVKDITIKLEYAKESGDQLAVNSILQRFIKLKKQMTRGLL